MHIFRTRNSNLKSVSNKNLKFVEIKFETTVLRFFFVFIFDETLSLLNILIKAKVVPQTRILEKPYSLTVCLRNDCSFIKTAEFSCVFGRSQQTILFPSDRAGAQSVYLYESNMSQGDLATWMLYSLKMLQFRQTKFQKILKPIHQSKPRSIQDIAATSNRNELHVDLKLSRTSKYIIKEI